MIISEVELVSTSAESLTVIQNKPDITGLA